MTDFSHKSSVSTPSIWSDSARRYTAFAFRRPILLLLLFSFLAVSFGFFAVNKLRVVTDLAALLPEGTPGVQALAESRRRVGSTDFFVIAAASKRADTRAIAQLQDTLKARIETEWKDAAWVQVSRDTTFFKNHALYYFDEHRLRELRDYLNEELVRVSAESMPGMVNLMGDAPSKSDARFDLTENLSEDELSGMGLPPQISEALARFFKPIEKAQAPQPPRKRRTACRQSFRIG